MCERTKMCAHMPDTIPAYAQVCARLQMRIFFMHACASSFLHARPLATICTHMGTQDAHACSCMHTRADMRAYSPSHTRACATSCMRAHADASARTHSMRIRGAYAFACMFMVARVCVVCAFGCMHKCVHDVVSVRASRILSPHTICAYVGTMLRMRAHDLANMRAFLCIHACMCSI